MTTRNDNWQGMNWIRQEKRLAIYMRDGLACVYCLKGVEDDEILTLDHLKVYSKGGSNHESNLVTACKTCNSSRGTKSVRAYCNLFEDGGQVERDVRNSAKRVLDMKAAKQLIAQRGSARQALIEVAA